MLQRQRLTSLTSLMTSSFLPLKTDQEEKTIAGTVFSDKSGRVVLFDRFHLDIIPEGTSKQSDRSGDKSQGRSHRAVVHGLRPGSWAAAWRSRSAASLQPVLLPPARQVKRSGFRSRSSRTAGCTCPPASVAGVCIPLHAEDRHTTTTDQRNNS